MQMMVEARHIHAQAEMQPPEIASVVAATLPQGIIITFTQEGTLVLAIRADSGAVAAAVVDPGVYRQLFIELDAAARKAMAGDIDVMVAQ